MCAYNLNYSDNWENTLFSIIYIHRNVVDTTMTLSSSHYFPKTNRTLAHVKTGKQQYTTI